MISHELPQLRAHGDVVAAVLEDTEIAGNPMVVVTIRECVSRPPHRRWYPDGAQALAYAAEQADRHSLPLLDLREPDHLG